MKLQNALCFALIALLVAAITSCEKTPGTNPEYASLGRSTLTGTIETLDFAFGNEVRLTLRDDQSDSLYDIDLSYHVPTECGQSTIDTADIFGTATTIEAGGTFDPDSQYVTFRNPQPVTLRLTSCAERPTKFDLGVKEIIARVTPETVIEYCTLYPNDRTRLLRTDSASRAWSEQFLEYQLLFELGSYNDQTPTLPYSAILLTVSRTNR